MIILNQLKSYAKFAFKVRAVGSLRSFFLMLRGVKPNTAQWEKRVLLMHLEAIGDLVVFTSVLKFYKQVFQGRQVHLLLKDSVGLEHALAPLVDKIVTVNYGKFVKNPWYGAARINDLRKIGFKTVVNHDHAGAEVSGKMIAVSLGAEQVIGYEGFGLQFQKPLDWNMKKNLAFVSKKLYPRFTTLVPSIDKHESPRVPFRHIIEHYAALYAAISGKEAEDCRTALSLYPPAEERTKQLLVSEGIEPGGYVVLNLGSSSSWKNWPVERFAEASSVFEERHIPLVLIGAPSEAHLGARFEHLYRGRVLNRIGKGDIDDTISLIQGCLLVFTNDTASVHIAVALEKPSLCIIGGGHLGNISFYGYRDINRWVYAKTECLGDNWRCAKSVGSGEVAPCIAAVGVTEVQSALGDLVGRPQRKPTVPFSISFFRDHGKNYQNF